METTINKLQLIQSELKAPKGNFNSFGKYKYRSCEDILEAVKPVLAKHGLAIVITDDIVLIGDRFYVKSTAVLINGEKALFNATGRAREAFDKKGMDDAQITGSASSYARKYALNGLLAIDDTKDADNTNKHEKAEFTVALFGKFKEKKSNYANANDAIAKISEKYIVGVEMTKQIKSLYDEDNYPPELLK